MKVSVIMITYQHEKYIAEALDSMLAQNVNFEYEILVGDDASTDKTPEIISEYQKRYSEIIKPVLHTENVGPVQNSLQLNQISKGEYIAYLEGDDFWISDTILQEKVDFLDVHPDYSLVCNRIEVVRSDGSPFPNEQLKLWFDNENYGDFSIDSGTLQPSQMSSFVHRKNFDNGFTWGEFLSLYDALSKQALGDNYTLAILYGLGKFYVMEESATAYRLQLESKTSMTMKNIRKKKDYLVLLKQTEGFYNEIKKHPKIQMDATDFIYFSIVLETLKSGNSREKFAAFHSIVKIKSLRKKLMEKLRRRHA
jgi:glycosyltransferase involved in cell wall biosynthesis